MPGDPRYVVPWLWNFPRDVRPRLRAKIDAYREGRRVIVLRSRRGIERFARSVENRATA